MRCGLIARVRSLLAGAARLNVIRSSPASDRSNRSDTLCAICGNCTLSALAGAGRLFLTFTESRCPPSTVPRTWAIDGGRGGHVVQLTVERHLAAPADTARPETVKHELKVGQ